ncbi:hypothetical protein Barb7_01427 [Bacteroidales bacterium Barb7]|nr:hypothetical protein Barb7_01427 [Bacteroidales bacterium Barb7]
MHLLPLVGINARESQTFIVFRKLGFIVISLSSEGADGGFQIAQSYTEETVTHFLVVNNRREETLYVCRPKVCKGGFIYLGSV